MEKNDNRNSGYYGRRVGGFEEEKKPKKRPEATKHPKSDFEQKQRYTQKQKRQRLRMKRIRALIILLVLIIMVVSLILMTPLFNIKSITVDGNERVTLDDIDAKVHYLSGQNLFRVSAGNIKKQLREISYIDDAEVTKKIYPPSIHLKIKESSPAGYIMMNGYRVVVDKNTKVLSDDREYNSNKIPEIRGWQNYSYKVGELFDTEGDSKNIVSACLTAMESVDIIESVEYIDISDKNEIKFGYGGRIEAICGSYFDMDEKIRLFKETVMSNSIAENAKYTVDLSVAGKAVYKP